MQLAALLSPSVPAESNHALYNKNMSPLKHDIADNAASKPFEPASSEAASEEQAAPSGPGEPPAEQDQPEMQCVGYEWDKDTHVLWLLMQGSDIDGPRRRIREAQVHHDSPQWLLQHWKSNNRPVNPHDPNLYEPFRIVREGTIGGKLGFWVQFVGFDTSKNNLGWLSEDDIAECAPGLVEEYRAETDVREPKRKRTGGHVGASRRPTGRETSTRDKARRSTRRRSERLTGC